MIKVKYLYIDIDIKFIYILYIYGKIQMMELISNNIISASLHFHFAIAVISTILGY